MAECVGHDKPCSTACVFLIICESVQVCVCVSVCAFSCAHVVYIRVYVCVCISVFCVYLFVYLLLVHIVWQEGSMKCCYSCVAECATCVTFLVNVVFVRATHKPKPPVVSQSDVLIQLL